MADIVIGEECLGCESCVELCPAVFEMDRRGSRAVVKDPASTAPCVDEAMDICPVGCIVREQVRPERPPRRP
jgi:ferredoxin